MHSKPTIHDPYGIWSGLLSELKPRKILEIGCYKGRTTCFLIDRLHELQVQAEIHCIDIWEDYNEIYDDKMATVEKFQITSI